jgi:AAA family ATP:ADP antiporter
MNTGGQLSRFERLLSLSTKVQAGEGRCVAVLLLQAVALMVAYYLIRPVREALILTEGGAELRSYAVGIQAILLMGIIPAYGLLVRAVHSSRVFQVVGAFFASNLVIFFLLGQAGFQIGLVFFIWASIFGVMCVTQFWAFATDLFCVKSGQRLFGVIAVGVSGGAWIGSRLSAAGFETFGPYGLMLASAGILVGTLCLGEWARRVVPAASQSAPESDAQRATEQKAPATRWLGGFAVIGRSRYLTCIAALVVLLNWITSTGEYVLSDWLVDIARVEAPDAQKLFIGRFMGNYSASITLVGFLIQLLVVSRVIMVAGVVRALIVTPVAFLAGYLLIGIVPVFALVQSVLVVQKSLDYSLLNTTRSALLLPTSRSVKYQAKTTIDTFFYRMGDLLSTLSVLVGLQVFDDPRLQFVWLIIVLSATMTMVAWMIGREYSRNFSTPRERLPGSALGSSGGGRGVLVQQPIPAFQQRVNLAALQVRPEPRLQSLPVQALQALGKRGWHLHAPFVQQRRVGAQRTESARMVDQH